MNSESNSHIFIVRIWWETREIENQPEIWRGKVEYLNDRKQKFFSNLDDLKSFIDDHIGGERTQKLIPPNAPHETLGIKIRRWLRNFSATK